MPLASTVAATELHVPNRKAIAAEPPGLSDASEAHASYQEYLRGLDDVPTLRHVIGEPPRVAVRDFRLGERPDVRSRSREDAYAVREQQARDLEQRYGEYVDALANGSGTVKPARVKLLAGGSGARKPAKKSGRSKRPKRAKRRKA
jgi:hypothetical protein